MTEPSSRPLRLLSDPQYASLFGLVGLLALALYFVGFELIPFIAALLLAYGLDAGVRFFMRRGMSRLPAVLVVFGLYLNVYVALLVGPIPLLARRALRATEALGGSSERFMQRIHELPDLSMGIVPESMRAQLADFLIARTQQWISSALADVIKLLPQVTSWVVFVFLVPVLVFFFLKDKEPLLIGVMRILPRRRELIQRIWREMETQLGNYVRGKLWEIVIVGTVTGIIFAVLGFEYPIVFGLLSGVSVVVPYVGAIGLAVPVFVQGYLQWGMTWPLGWLMIAYTVIQFVDGNVLVPYIFSETVSLHPVVILLAVFVFGSLWGFWGVLFAIPLATFAKALLGTILEFRDGKGTAPEQPGAPGSGA